MPDQSGIGSLSLAARTFPLLPLSPKPGRKLKPMPASHASHATPYPKPNPDAFLRPKAGRSR